MPSIELQKFAEQKRNDKDVGDFELTIFRLMVVDAFRCYISEKNEKSVKELQTTVFNTKINELRCEFLIQDQTFVDILNGFVDRLFVNREDVRKNNEKVKEFIEKGNKHLTENNYEEALKCFSDAIDIVPTESEHLRSLFDHRSKVLFHLNHYEDAVKDIDRAFKYASQSSESQALFIRKIKCLRSLGKEPEANAVINSMTSNLGKEIEEELLKQIIEDSRNKSNEVLRENQRVNPKQIDTEIRVANKTIANASDAVQLQYTSAKTRYIVAKKNIEASEVIFAEEPLEVWLRPSNYKRFCYNCLRQLRFAHYPCGCCSMVRFCNELCASESWDKSHSQECPYMDILSYLSYSSVALKLLLKNRIDKTMNEYAKTELYKADLNSFLSLQHTYPKEVVFETTLESLAVALLCLKMNIIKHSFASKDFLSFAGLLLKLTLRCRYYRKNVYFDNKNSSVSFNIPFYLQSVTNVGIGIYPSMSLMYYTCDNQTYDIFIGPKLVVKTSEDIKKGEELTNNLMIEAALMTLNDRQSLIRTRFNYNCCCKRCNEKKETIWLAFRCRHCSGPLVVNKDKSNFCVNCGKSNANIGEVNAASEAARATFLKATAMCKTHPEESKNMLYNCLAMFQSLLYCKHVTLSNVHFELGISNAIEKKYKIAAQQYRAAYDIRADCYGTESYATLLCSVRIVWLMIKEAKGLKNQKDRKKKIDEAKQSFTKYEKVYDKLVKNEYKTLKEERESLCVKKLFEIISIAFQSGSELKIKSSAIN